MFTEIKAKLLFLSLFVTQLSYAGHFTPPTPTITSGTCTDIVVHDELYGFPNYGATDSAADIAYRGDKNTWVFQIPSGYQPSDFNKAFFSISLVLDDHDSVSTDLYTMKISIDNKRVYSGLTNLPHGGPYSSIFSNWVQRDYFVQTPLSPTMTFKLSNTSANTNADDWIGIDWIELHLLKCSSEEAETKSVTVGPVETFISSPTANFNETVALPKFNPALGTLNSISLKLQLPTMRAMGYMIPGGENLDFTYSLNLFRPDNSELISVRSSSSTMEGCEIWMSYGLLCSGINIEGDTAVKLLVDTADLKLFTGTDTNILTVVGNAGVDLNSSWDYSVEGPVSVTATYNYTPISATNSN